MWQGPCRPPGSTRPKGLVLRLEDDPVERILGSPTLRCHQTIQPLARDRLLGIEPLAALGVDGDPSELLALFSDRQLPNTVLCTHGEMIGRLFARLTTGQGLVAPAPLVWPKGSAWLLHRTDWRQLHARYLSPLALEHRVPTS